MAQQTVQAAPSSTPAPQQSPPSHG
jgi:hypothetical protein